MRMCACMPVCECARAPARVCVCVKGREGDSYHCFTDAQFDSSSSFFIDLGPLQLLESQGCKHSVFFLFNYSIESMLVVV